MSENFELLRNVTIGQYIPTGSVIHKLDPRAKILGLIIIMLAVSFSSSFFACALLLTLVLTIARVAQIPLSYVLRGLLLAAPVLTFIFLLQIVFRSGAEPAGQVYWDWGWFRLTRLSMQGPLVGVMRIMSFVFATSLLTMTTTTTELTHGVEGLLQPFRRFGMPSHELALINMIALRFLPTLAEETERVMKAQASRGGEFGRQRFWRPDIAVRIYLPLLIPLFLNAFRRAEDLILAMEARCYVSGANRTKFILLQPSIRDGVALLSLLAISFTVALFPWPALHEVLRGWV